MHRRSFIARCGMAAVGTTFFTAVFPAASPLQAVTLRPQPSPQLTAADRALLGLLSAYSADVYFWGDQVFTRAAGLTPRTSVTRLRVQVASNDLLTAFLQSDAMNALGIIHVAGQDLSFNFMGSAYVVTNQSAEEFTGGLTTNQVGPQGAVVRHAVDARFTHETMVYHPGTDALSDPHLALKKRSINLVAVPTGNIQAKFQTLVHGWVASGRYGLKLSKQFRAFQDELLASEPTAKAARKVVRALLEGIPALAAAFDVEALRPLLTSPLVSASLQQTLGLDGEAVLTEVATLRAQLADGDYTDAALWLAALLRTQFQGGTAGEWLDVLSGEDAADGSTLAAFSSASQLVQARGR